MTNHVPLFPRISKQALLLVVDVFIVVFSLISAFSLRLGIVYVPEPSVVMLFAVAPLIAIPVFTYFNLYKAVIRYIGGHGIWSIVKAVSLYSLIWGTVVMLSGVGMEGVPRSVILINWLVVMLLLVSSRLIARSWLTGTIASHIFDRIPHDRKKIAIYGAGPSGVQLANALSYNSKYKPIAFLDDNLYLRNYHVSGFKVLSVDKLEQLIKHDGVTDVFLAMPFISRARKNEIIKNLKMYPVSVRSLPDIAELAKGTVKFDDIKEVEIEDLLGRGQVSPNVELLKRDTEARNILVTGAGGSIGSELCRQIIRLQPKRLVLFERGEFELYSIERELQTLISQRKYSIDIIPVLASVTDEDRVYEVCKAFSVDTIYHAAAYKHVPMVEKNPGEAIKNNIFGTLSCAKAAVNSGVDTFVLVSTDKAVRPTNIMGASKRFAELILQAMSLVPGENTRFTMVRFGNVLGSSGSVVPLFREQIKAGGPITITDPEIIRYFMTIPEAAQLVIQAGAMGSGGDVFLLDMGEPIKIMDLATSMIRLSGLELKDKNNLDGDIEIKITGLRPGEKLYEELLIGGNVTKTAHPLIMRAEENVIDMDVLRKYLDELMSALLKHDNKSIREILLKTVDGYSPQCGNEDVVDCYKEKLNQANLPK